MLRLCRHPILALVLFVALRPLPAARAEDSPLSGTTDRAPALPDTPPASSPFPVIPESPSETGPGEESDEPPRPAPVAVTPKPSPRFGLDERARFRRWLNELCRQEPVETPDAERVRFAKDKGPTVSKATNKAGSLLLLLENYAELTKFRDYCESARKKNPDACIQQGRLPHTWDLKQPSERMAWVSFGSNRFWTDIRQNRTPAGIAQRTDLLDESKERVRQLELTLKKNFFELRDAADLNGVPGSGPQAGHLAKAVRDESTCGTRAVAERAPASQK